uniref:Major facilitator superfamily (MFS) profile domain-containing protein n=1 Tax=Amphora coffeiformis TaxID=265554 RepID=A0A6S8J6A7_9STRA
MTTTATTKDDVDSDEPENDDEWEAMPPAAGPTPACVVLDPQQESSSPPLPPSEGALDQSSLRLKNREVHFGTVQVREYSRTIGDNPFCSKGAPIALDWDYHQGDPVSLDWHELDRFSGRRRKTSARRLLLDPLQRRMLLWRWGFEIAEIDAAVKRNEQEKRRQSINQLFLPWFVLQEFVVTQQSALRKSCGCHRYSTNNSTTSDDFASELSYQEEKVRQLHQRQFSAVDAEHGGLPPWRQHQHHGQVRRRLSFRKQSSLSLPNDSSSQLSDGGADSTDHNLNNNSDHDSVASARSVATAKVEYKIRTDPRQHDKATEIILCSYERPHMRAFHGSWFGFFIGFIMWFAITPLLGEVQATLGLTKSEIWTSSLAGTSMTVFARAIMGPLCDVYGARKCMAAIVLISAIPCGLTGLVQTARGLSVVRAFIGIAGSAFVPCQYWTSRMFAREVAGTANALVAGWGNLGGGVAQLLMGSALFPLFQLIFQGQDNADELAWRSVFVVPALIAFMATYVYIYQCDDSPKGDFAELVRQQQIEMVSPFWSLGMAIQNRNVILLLLQYACCFGVEITMTNATALYMRDKFGLETAAAAAVASVFGIMNLFARGLGGYGSDQLNSRFGTNGRVVWQGFTLFMEGASVIAFSFVDTLVGAVILLIFLSFWVQCAEGATYGIVPYVNRRFTGREFNYEINWDYEMIVPTDQGRLDREQVNRTSEKAKFKKQQQKPEEEEEEEENKQTNHPHHKNERAIIITCCRYK